MMNLLVVLWKMATSFAVLCIVAGAAAFAGGTVALLVALMHRAADEIAEKRRKK